MAHSDIIQPAQATVTPIAGLPAETGNSNEVYGRVLEGVHVAGYSLERAFGHLEWLLSEDRWRRVGRGFDDVNAFLESVRLESFRIVADQRKSMVRRIKALQPAASNRALAKAIGVDEGTIRNDQRAENSAATEKNVNNTNRQNSTPAEDSALREFSGERAGKLVLRAETLQARAAARKIEFERPIIVSLAPGLHHGDFRILSDQIEDDSVDLVLTDPIYWEAPLYGEAARIAARILKPGGSFLAYTGQTYHDRAAMDACEPFLRHWWTLTVEHSGGSNLLPKLGVRCGCKHVLWYVKGTRANPSSIIYDPIRGTGREKDLHPWQHAEGESRYLIEKLTSQGGLVVDFFAGSGTTCAAAKALGRRWIGFEIGAATAERASQRIEAGAAPDPVAAEPEPNVQHVEHFAPADTDEKEVAR